MNKKRLLCIVLSFAAVCSLFLVDNSVAWFNMKTGVQLSQDLTIPKMDYAFSGELGSYYYKDKNNEETEFIITDENLIVTEDGQNRVISLVNHSGIDTEVRFRIKYPTPDGTATYDPEDESCPLAVTLSTDKTWTYADGYYAADFSAAEDEENGDPFDVIEDIRFIEDDDTFNKDYYLHGGENGDPLSGEVAITFQAKQKDHVDWSDIWTTSTTP